MKNADHRGEGYRLRQSMRSSCVSSLLNDGVRIDGALKAIFGSAENAFEWSGSLL